ncbi:MAG: helix-turn-helix domain-containing protein [Myxococcota bacterium]
MQYFAAVGDADDTPRDKPGIGKGVLQPQARAGKFSVARFYPPDDLAPFIEHFWTVVWDLGDGAPHVQETLPYPAIHVAVERGNSEIVGVITGKFTRTIVGHGRVFAAKFKPAGFFPLWGHPLAGLTDRRVGLDELFDVDVGALEAEVFDHDDPKEMVAPLAEVFRARVPAVDDIAEELNEWVQRIESDRCLTSVAALAEIAGVSVRTLQRLFQRYVGVTPKWVIRRFRLQEAAEALAGRASLNLAALASELGYADQAHFVRDFRALVGATPAAYAKLARDA